MILFILSLIRASHSSAKQVEVQIEQGGIVNKPPEWESFPFLFGYYGGLRSLVDKSANVPEYPGEASNGTELDSIDTSKAQRPSRRFNPYPAYTSEEYIEKHGRKVDCFLDEAGKVSVPQVHMYEGIPMGMPDAVFGSASMLGMRDDICFDRLGRLGPYGLGYSIARGGSGASMNGDRDGADSVWQETPEVDWRKVRWSDVQKRCAAANKHRFVALPESKHEHVRPVKDDSLATSIGTDKGESEPKEASETLPRIAVVIRTWWGFEWTPESIIYVRSIIAELALNTGAEYTVHFLIQVRDDNVAIWSDDETYERVMRESLPEEFMGMGTLWTERQMFLVYGGLQETWARDLPVHGVYRSSFMPVQYFAYQHPEYEHFWQWEMDARYTGHYYHLFDSVTKWAKEQPRKHLWERNSRFYIPTEHGSWEDFRQMVRVQTEAGTNSPNNMWSGLKQADSAGGDKSPTQSGEHPIWGPEPPLDDDVSFELDPQPPTPYAQDKYTWGVGEEADLITFNPLFDPEGTTWLLADDVTGYNTTRALPPRRAAIITASRLSRRLLLTMHHETAISRHTMFSEMWPASCALHHGFKAVYAPQAEYIDRRWPTSYLASTFNGGRNGATGGARTSVFGDREHNFRGVTWYYNAGFPEVLWHRWLGYRFNNDGGEEWEVSGQGRMCLPGMLLHPIKRVDLVQEGKKVGD